MGKLQTAPLPFVYCVVAVKSMKIALRRENRSQHQTADCKLGEGQSTPIPVTRLQPWEGRATEAKGTESSGKDSAWGSIPFEAYNAIYLLREGSPRKSA
jgi:hypothetical protein